MDPFYWVLLAGVAVLALVIGAAIAWMILRSRHHHRLRDRFESEYDRVLEKTGDRRGVEEELRRREQRVKQFEIRALSPEQRSRYAEDWRKVQARFVDTPGHAVAEADSLVTEVMRTRGYPMGDFEQRAEDLSVDHPRVVGNYRAAHDLAVRNERGEADTEDLRQAMIHYRELFEDLLEQTVSNQPAQSHKTR